MPEPLLRLQRILLKQTGGDRVMADVLGAIPKHGLDAVLVAVELALESGRPSGEHVMNACATEVGHSDAHQDRDSAQAGRGTEAERGSL